MQGKDVGRDPVPVGESEEEHCWLGVGRGGSEGREDGGGCGREGGRTGMERSAEGADGGGAGKGKAKINEKCRLAVAVYKGCLSLGCDCFINSSSGL